MTDSCSPSTTRFWTMDSFCMQLRAMRDVKEGEEITTQYCTTLDTAADRQKELQRYGFQCTCRSCTDYKTSDPLRLQCRKTHSPMDSDGTQWSFDLPTSVTLKPWLESKAIHEKEGLETTEGYLYSVFMLMKIYAAKGDVENTKLYAKKIAALRLARTGAVTKQKDLDSAFGLVAVAEMVMRMKGKMKSKAKGSAAK